MGNWLKCVFLTGHKTELRLTVFNRRNQTIFIQVDCVNCGYKDIVMPYNPVSRYKGDKSGYKTNSEGSM